MSFYETLTTASPARIENLTAEPLDDDVKQTALLRSFRAYINKHGTSEGFEQYQRTPRGEAALKKFARFAYVDIFNDRNLRKRNRDKDSKLSEVMKQPVSTSAPSTMTTLEGMSQGEETNIARAQKQMELQDEIRTIYENGDDLKKNAMDLMMEAMQFKDDGKPVPARIRMAISRLRDEIQKTDPRWKLDLHLL